MSNYVLEFRRRLVLWQAFDDSPYRAALGCASKSFRPSISAKCAASLTDVFGPMAFPILPLGALAGCNHKSSICRRPAISTDGLGTEVISWRSQSYSLLVWVGREYV